MARRSILMPEQQVYLDSLVKPGDALVTEMESHAKQRGLSICRPTTARLLTVIGRAVEARRVLELGTGIGRGTLALASAGGETRITTIDRDGVVQQAALAFLKRAGLAERVERVEGEAVEILPTLEGPYDLLFVDVDKADDRRCLDLGLQLLRVGGVVVVEHVLCAGRVAEPGAEADDDVEAAYSFNGYFSSHPQLLSVLLPVDDGVGLAVKLRSLMTDLGGPY